MTGTLFSTQAALETAGQLRLLSDDVDESLLEDCDATFRSTERSRYTAIIMPDLANSDNIL